MAFKGTAGKSASGASMSKYDVEVESRLKKLEAQAHEKCDDGSLDGTTLTDLKKSIFENGISSDKVSDIDSKIDWIIEVIKNDIQRDYYEETKIEE
tara:strand:- start:153 stop:440 length:288 start_codon:yes stop_codon:yes gene_type:complete